LLEALENDLISIEIIERTAAARDRKRLDSVATVAR
jgi:hypothetical protein